MIQKFAINALLAVLLSSLHGPVLAATCSCAGAPLLSFIDVSAVEKGQLFITYATEDHQINDLVSGRDDVKDETLRDRQTFSQVLSVSYAMSDRWAISALASYVEHKRTIGTSFLGSTRTSGLGDSVVMARYTPLFITPFSRHELSLGLGARVPTGDDDFGNTFVVSEDMQPSTGAWGTILWSSYKYAFDQAATMQLTASASYTANEENKREYAFGDESILSLGFSHSIGTKFGYSAALRYRHTDADTRLGFKIPNTGGEWLDFVPAIQYAVTDSLRLGLSGRIPVARNLNGALQFTTSYSYGFTITYGF